MICMDVFDDVYENGTLILLRKLKIGDFVKINEPCQNEVL